MELSLKGWKMMRGRLESILPVLQSLRGPIKGMKRLITTRQKVEELIYRKT